MKRLAALTLLLLAIAATFWLSPALGAALAALVLAANFGLSLCRSRRQVEAVVTRGAEHGRDRADFLGFTNIALTGRRRSPDFQYLTRAPRDATPHVLDRF